MLEKIDKRIRAATFRNRLLEAMGRKSVSRSGLARAAGVDRSTIAQLLTDDGARMPSGHLAADCARALGVSADWLLGLIESPETASELVAAAVTVAGAERTLSDEQLHAWHEEARGHKVRHVPATLPDIFKTEDVLAWEYQTFLGKTPDQAIAEMQKRREWMRARIGDFEVAVSIGEVEAFAAAAGYYRDMPPEFRAPQLRAFAAAADEYYPAVRLHFYDARRVYSAPLTIFGPIVATVYVGGVYIAFRTADRIRALTRHFDGLVREAAVDARYAGDWLAERAGRLDAEAGRPSSARTHEEGEA